MGLGPQQWHPASPFRPSSHRGGPFNCRFFPPSLPPPFPLPSFVPCTLPARFEWRESRPGAGETGRWPPGPHATCAEGANGGLSVSHCHHHPLPHPSLLGRRHSQVPLRDPGGKQANRHHRHSMTPSYFPPDPSLPSLTLPPDPSLPFLTLPPLTSLPLPPEARAPRSAPPRHGGAAATTPR